MENKKNYSLSQLPNDDQEKSFSEFRDELLERLCSEICEYLCDKVREKTNKMIRRGFRWLIDKAK